MMQHKIDIGIYRETQKKKKKKNTIMRVINSRGCLESTLRLCLFSLKYFPQLQVFGVTKNATKPENDSGLTVNMWHFQSKYFMPA